MSRNVPKLRFKGFEDEWKECKLSSLGKSLIGLTYSPDDITCKDNGILVLRSSNIKNDRLEFIDNVYVNSKIKNDIFVKNNDILICSRNGSRALIGKSALIKELNEKATFGAFMTVFRSNNGEFIYQLIKTREFFKQINMNLGATINQITSGNLNSFKFKLPSAQEQEKIANFLSRVDSIIEKQEKKVEYWNSYKKGMMQKIFSQKIRFKDKKGRDYPEWEKVHLNKFVERVVRKNKDNVSKRPLTISAQYGLVDQEEFFNKLVASKNLEGYYLLKNGEFAYNKSYSTGYPFGAIKRLDKYENGAVSTLYICFKVKNNINSDFIAQYFESSKWHKEIAMIAVEGARNHGLLNVSVSNFFETIHYIPCLEEQNKISKFLLNIDNILFKENKKLEELVQWKKGLLQQMFI